MHGHILEMLILLGISVQKGLRRRSTGRKEAVQSRLS